MDNDYKKYYKEAKVVKKEDDDFCEEVYKNIKKWDDHFEHNKDFFKENLAFVYGYQWTEEEKQKYRQKGRCPRVINLLMPILIHICGEQLKNTPALSVKALTDDASDEDIQIRQSLIEKSALSNNSKVAYQVAYQNLLCGGFGALLVENYYENSIDLKQNVKISGVDDPTTCFFDKNANEIDKSDGTFCGRKIWCDKKKIEEEYDIDLDNKGIVNSDYIMHDKVCVVDYFKRNIKSKYYIYLDNGERVEKSFYKANKDFYNAQSRTKVGERKVLEYEVKRYKIAGNYILEKSEFPSKYMGYLFIPYDMYIDEDECKRLSSFFEQATDSQKAFNEIASDVSYLSSEENHGKFLGHLQNMKGVEEYWQNDKITQKLIPYSVYQDPMTGQTITPQPYNEPVISPSLVPIYNSYKQAIHETLGIYHTQMGNQGNEVSGTAINARTHQGNLTTYKSVDSLNRGIRQAGNIVLDMISRLWVNEMRITIESEHGETQEKVLNELKGYKRVNDMTKGEYNVYIEPSVNFDSQKEFATEDIEKFMAMTQNPAFAMFGDKIAKSFPDLPYRKEMIKRASMLLSPEIKKELGMPVPPPQPNPEVELKQQEQQLKQQELQNKSAKIQQDAQKDAHDMMIKEQDLQLREQEQNQDSQQQRMDAVIKLMEIKEEEKATYMRAAAEAHKTETEKLTTFQKEYMDMYKKLLELEHKYNNVN